MNHSYRLSQMAALIVLVLAASLYSTVVDGRTLPQSEEFQSLCSGRCGVGGAASEADSTEAAFPRFRCSCSPSCAVYEDCCYDSPHKNASMWQQFKFVCVSVVGRDRYRAVSSCPPSQRSDFCRGALGHLPPVTSRTTNVTYGNVFCASCNGDRDDLVTWNVELRCPLEDEDGKDDELKDSETRIVYGRGEFWKIDDIRKSKRLCKFYAHFDDYSIIDGLELRSCEAREGVSRCSASWSDMSVAENCRSYEDPIYFDDTAYRNPHCALCNYLSLEFGDCLPFRVKNMLRMELEADSSSVFEFCRDRGSQACVRYLSDWRKGRPFSLTHVLNVWISECLPPDCCEGQRYDFRTKRCRKVRRGR